MKISRLNQSEGFTLLELLVVISIIGALSSIAIPYYATSREKAKTAGCLANRRNIEMEERAYFSDHDTPKLEIDGRYACPSGGIYVWLISDPDDTDYPQLGCSIHFTGLATATPIPAVSNNPISRIQSLIAHIPSLNLKKKKVCLF